MRFLVNTIYSGYRRIIPQVIVFKRTAGDILESAAGQVLNLVGQPYKNDYPESLLCFTKWNVETNILRMEHPVIESSPPLIRHIWCSVSLTKKFEDVFVQYIISQAQQGTSVSEYIVYLSTTGGSPFSAINLYNFLKTLPQKTTVYNMGNVASAGVTFFLGFQNRIGVPDCSFMIHQTTIDKQFLPGALSVFDLQSQIDSLSATDKKTRVIIQKETKPRASKVMNEKFIKNAVLKSTTFHTDEAKDRGFIDHIETPTLPVEGVLYITDQYLATLAG